MKPPDLARVILDLGARWFDARASVREEEPRRLHAHWSPESRSWRYHVHSEDDSAAPQLSPATRGPREACFAGWGVGGVPGEAGGGGGQLKPEAFVGAATNAPRTRESALR